MILSTVSLVCLWSAHDEFDRVEFDCAVLVEEECEADGHDGNVESKFVEGGVVCVFIIISWECNIEGIYEVEPIRDPNRTNTAKASSGRILLRCSRRLRGMRVMFHPSKL